MSEPDEILDLLLTLKSTHGSLDTALIRLWVYNYGPQSERALAQDLGLGRRAIRRALQDWSETNHPLPPEFDKG